MDFKNYLHEAVIVPPKLSIKTNDIKKLEKQFKNTIITFEISDGGTHAAYVPENESIIVYLDKDGDTPPAALEAIIQHEIIHSIQDDKSNMRMADNIQIGFEQLRAMNKEILSIDDDEEIDPKLVKKYQDLVAKMDFLNPEEEMAYAYMYVKMYKELNLKELLKKMTAEWVKWTNKKPSKKMLKYFYSYWMIRKEL